MRRILPAVFLLVATTLTHTRASNAPRPGVDWPQFRGISAGGIAEGFSIPATWNAANNTNVAWKTPIPGLGLSSPVVWGDTVFVSTSISGKTDANLKVGLYGDISPVQDDTVHEWRVYALDKKSGKIKWQQTTYTGVPKIKRHMKNSHANSTLATDGERVIAFFGSEGLYAYDMKGNSSGRRISAYLTPASTGCPRRNGRRAARRCCMTAW
ncbi:MAG TPA: PQQ-binding-like beta-propeller repeat protein [Vicinamibacterales bacterium]|nr:PQQ-binding-like beta-propeller repeat protein [Vicinamibacterales bacterium]